MLRCRIVKQPGGASTLRAGALFAFERISQGLHLRASERALTQRRRRSRKESAGEARAVVSTSRASS